MRKVRGKGKERDVSFAHSSRAQAEKLSSTLVYCSQGSIWPRLIPAGGGSWESRGRGRERGRLQWSALVDTQHAGACISLRKRLCSCPC